MEASTQTTEITADTAQRTTKRPQSTKTTRKPRAKKPAPAPSEPVVERVEEQHELTAPQEVGHKEQGADDQAVTAAREEAAATDDAADGAAEPEAGEKTAGEPAQEAADEPAGETAEDTREHAIASIRAHETPIFAAMFAHWDGPAVGLIGRNLHRADADTMIFDAVMWRPDPDAKAPSLRFRVGGDRHAPVVTATGELTAGSVSLLATPLRHILRRRPRQLIVDLAGITQATPAGLRALLDVRQAARAGHVDFWLRAPSESVRVLLQPAGKQIAVRPDAPARKSSHSSRKGVEGADADSTSETAAQSKGHAITAKLPGIHRRAAEESRVLEGVVVESPASRTRPRWFSHSLRRVGAHQNPNGHGAPT